MSANFARCYNDGLMRRVLIVVFLVLIVSSLLAAPRARQERPPVPPATPATPAVSQADQTLSVEVNLVNILFTVADRKGKFVTNLKKEDFKVFEDERIQSVTNFSSENNLPLTIALL